jgi:phosphoglycolate phosphatase-like HAD superfamily hydrolase
MEMRQSRPSQFTEELRKIIDQQNYLGLTSIISKFIRSFLNLNLKPLLVEREKLRSDFQKLKADETGKDEMLQKVKTEKDEMLKKIEELSKTVEQRYYSNEFLYREYYISELSKIKGSEKPPIQSFNDYLSLCNLQI